MNVKDTGVKYKGILDNMLTGPQIVGPHLLADETENTPNALDKVLVDRRTHTNMIWHTDIAITKYH